MILIKMMEENDNQHHQLFLFKGQTVVSSSDGNVESIELTNIGDDIDNNSDSGISPNDSEIETLIF